MKKAAEIRHWIWGIGMAVCLFQPQTARAQDQAALTPEGRWSEGECYTIEGNGSTGYYASGATLEIVDFTNPAQPVKLSSTLLPGAILGMDRQNNILYAVGGPGFLEVIDVQDPAKPVVLAHLDLPFSLDVEYADGYAYISSSVNGLTIVDVSVPTQPVVVSTMPTNSELYTIAVAGDYAYGGTYTGYTIVDIHSKTNPVVVNDISLGGLVRGAAARDTLLCLPALDLGLQIYSISHPAEPKLLSTYYPQEVAEDVIFHGEYVFLAGRYQGVYILDLADPSTPVAINHIDTRRAASLDASGSYLYVADTWSMSVLDISHAESAAVIANLPVADQINGLAVKGSNVCIAQNYFGMTVLDVSDIHHPVSASYFQESNEAHDVAIRDTLAYLASRGNGLMIISIADPVHPYLVRQLLLESPAIRIALDQEQAYVGMSNGGLAVIDISDPAIAYPLNVIYLDHAIFEVVAQDGFLFVCYGRNGMQLFNLAVPASPVPIAYYVSGNWITDIAIHGRYAYLSQGGQGLRILDLINPNAPEWVADLDLPDFASQIELIGGYAFLLTGSKGIYLADIHDPYAPKEVAHADFGSGLVDLAVSGHHLYAASTYDGLYIFAFDSLAVRVEEPETIPDRKPSWLQAVYPNPFDREITFDYVVEEAGLVSLTFCAMDGSCRILLMRDYQLPGSYRYTWTASPKDLVPGIYYVKATYGRKTQTIPMTWIR